MIVRLTHTQATAVMLRLGEFYATHMREHRETRGRIQHDYDLPAIAWRQILDGMVAQCFGPKGGKLKGAGRPSDSAYIAIRKIADAVRTIEGHPALRGASIEGWVPDMVPAWRRMQRVFPEDPMRPYPTLDVPSGQMWPFVVLTPVHIMNLDMKLTRWEQVTTINVATLSSWTFHEDAHLLFSGARAAASP